LRYVGIAAFSVLGMALTLEDGAEELAAVIAEGTQR
jgi:hypothetical protein